MLQRMEGGDGDRKPVCKYFGQRIANVYLSRLSFNEFKLALLVRI